MPLAKRVKTSQKIEVKAVNRLFKWTLVIGILVTSFGVIAGFTTMFMGLDNFALYFIGVVPIGFLFVFAALTGWIMAGGK